MQIYFIILLIHCMIFMQSVKTAAHIAWIRDLEFRFATTFDTEKIKDYLIPEIISHSVTLAVSRGAAVLRAETDGMDSRGGMVATGLSVVR